MIKVALCLSGQPRCLDQTIESLFQYIIDEYDTDIFIHFWNTSYATSNSELNKTWYGKQDPGWKQFDGDFACRMIDSLQPRRFIVQPQLRFPDEEYRLNCTAANSRMQAKSFQNVLSMYFSIKMASDCMLEWELKNGFIYDYVIRSRTDLEFFASPNLFEKDCLLIPEQDGYGGYNDQFAVGPRDLMGIYANCFDNIPYLFKSGTNFHPETILRDHLKSFNVPVKALPPIYKLLR